MLAAIVFLGLFILIIACIWILAKSQVPRSDTTVSVKSRQALEKYDATQFFRENCEKLSEAERVIKEKGDSSEETYTIGVHYISPAGRKHAYKNIVVNRSDIDMYKRDPSLLMSKGEYSKYIKTLQKEDLNQKQHEYYERVNSIIDYANKNKGSLVIAGGQSKLDQLIDQLFDRTVNSIKKIKSIDSEEWSLIENYIVHIKEDVETIIRTNQRILDYYNSQDFAKIKETCKVMMDSQRGFNEYINEKVQSISHLFGTRVIRNATISKDEFNYIRPYQKTISPFTAEVSATVFASAENRPLEYIVKYFYPDKNAYPEQIQNLCQLVEELETLRDAKKIIENYKAEYQQYLGDVPEYIMENDEDGFYSRLGFATINESVLSVEYKFSYTSSGGMAQRSFSIPMTEETIAELIKVLDRKLSSSEFAKEQRTLMTKKLREDIKVRDNYTCRLCGNSIQIEPNLLLEIDHIIPIAKGGRTEKENLQTLCWKCNRSKSDKLLE